MSSATIQPFEREEALDESRRQVLKSAVALSTLAGQRLRAQSRDLLAGFQTRQIPTSGATIHVRTAGSGPPLLLLHGFPQTNIIWHKIAADLAKRFTVVAPDLRGYGFSSKHWFFSDTGGASEALSERHEPHTAVLGWQRSADV